MKRRTLLAAAVALTGCRREATSYRFLSDAEAAALRALCGQIIPGDDQPGADWAGAVQFIDIQLTHHYKQHRKAYRTGIAKADAIAHARFGRALDRLSPAQQLECAKELERADGVFFDLLVAHTMQSYYGSPRHGGNRDAVSWRMLGVATIPVRGRDQRDIPRGPAT
jgi:gluconate 2-dehydrogenase gamma chain